MAKTPLSNLYTNVTETGCCIPFTLANRVDVIPLTVELKDIYKAAECKQQESPLPLFRYLSVVYQSAYSSSIQLSIHLLLICMLIVHSFV